MVEICHESISFLTQRKARSLKYSRVASVQSTYTSEYYISSFRSVMEIYRTSKVLLYPEK